jgi:hypothetical protein
MPAFGGAGLLAKSMKETTTANVSALFDFKDTKGFFRFFPEAEYGFTNLSDHHLEANEWIFVASNSFMYFLDYLPRLGHDVQKLWKEKKITLILTDSHYCKSFEKVNLLAKQHDVRVFAMTDLYIYREGIPTIPYFSPMGAYPIAKVNKDKKKIVVSHTPYHKGRPERNTKGTNQIREVLEKLALRYPKLEYHISLDSTLDEVMELKAKSHIFIDQLIENNPFVPQEGFGGKIVYKGGLGKSGLEAMHMRNAVLTSGREVDTRPFFPPPPIVWIDYQNFEQKLVELIEDVKLRTGIAERQYEWAAEFTSSEFVANHVLNAALREY